MYKQLYVMPCFLKPGKHTFIVQSLVSYADITEIKSYSKSTTLLDEFEGRSRFTGLGKSFNMEELAGQHFYHEVAAPQRLERVPLCKRHIAFGVLCVFL